MSRAYREAGVDVAAGREAVGRIARHAARTHGPEVLGGLGGFGAAFRFDAARYREPVLVSGADGVGTKLKVATLAGRFDTVGIDCVAMVVNDLCAQGAEPLFFLDYVAAGRLDPEVVEAVVAGLADGCVQAGCALVGGETAEMPGLYAPGDVDLAGFGVGVAERDRLVDGARTQAGDAVLGLASSGLHANGFSLVRKLLFEDRDLDAATPLRELPGEAAPRAAAGTLADLLLTPTRIYAPALARLAASGVDVRGLAHVTGGGLVENLPRALAPGLRAVLPREALPLPPVMRWLAELGELGEADLLNTFNCGVGMAVVVAAERADEAARVLFEAGETVVELGRVEGGDGGVRLTGPEPVGR